MFSEKDFQVARRIANVLTVPEQFGDSDYGEIRRALDTLEDVTILSINSGCTRLVIIPMDYHWVLKIAFNGIWDWGEDTGEDIFTFFSCDYNEREYNKIKLAQENGYGDLFPDMAFVCEVNGCSAYIQEKIPYGAWVGDQVIKVSKNSNEIAHGMQGIYSQCNELFRASAIEHFGETFWKTFIDWEAAENVGIFEDMHGGNYGFRANGEPVFMDVAGYDPV